MTVGIEPGTSLSQANHLSATVRWYQNSTSQCPPKEELNGLQEPRIYFEATLSDNVDNIDDDNDVNDDNDDNDVNDNNARLRRSNETNGKKQPEFFIASDNAAENTNRA